MTAERKGQISVETADIFPIIKRWLYSEHDIFLRELVANATDAIAKRAQAARMGNKETPEGQIHITLRPKEKTITIEDNGIGMSESEVEKYIARLAFSGAEEFVKKMKEAGESADMIGKFGLGFYSSFMAANKVEVDSLTMEEGGVATHWVCEGRPEYTFGESDRKNIGTAVTLHINEESKEFLDEFRVREVLKKFCGFMPYKISILDNEKKVKPTKEDGTIDEKAPEVAATPTVINEKEPLWKKEAKNLKDQDYKDFFSHLYPLEAGPLFWVHLKIDHPFTLEGILYFPRINPTKPFQEKNIRLYCKQVFVSDNVKDIIPEFLSLLKGVIDSSDIPLNVSRSSLQGDPNVKKISNYITKKVAESLKKLFKKERKKYEEIWSDIALFVKYGCISDDKFSEAMLPFILFKGHGGKLITLEEYRDSVPEKYKEKMAEKIIYVEKDKSNQTLRDQFKDQGIEVIETENYIDPHFMQHVEMKSLGKEKIKFGSVDSEIHQIFETEGTSGEDIKVKELFEQILVPPKEDNKKDPSDKEIELQKIKNTSLPAYIKVDEQMKRFETMSRSMGQGNTFPPKKTLVINPANPLIQSVLNLHEKGNNRELVDKVCHHIEDLALISSEELGAKEKELFVRRGQEILLELFKTHDQQGPGESPLR